MKVGTDIGCRATHSAMVSKKEIESYLMQNCPEWLKWGKEVSRRSRKVL